MTKSVCHSQRHHGNEVSFLWRNTRMQGLKPATRYVIFRVSSANKHALESSYYRVAISSIGVMWFMGRICITSCEEVTKARIVCKLLHLSTRFPPPRHAKMQRIHTCD
ncbi:hypothetical protein ISCGN_004603 [Ixodes scapularis]